MLKTFSGRNASQNEFELRSFIALLQERGVTKYAEIGARHGDTFVEVMESLPAGSYGMALDLPGGLWGKSTTGTQLQKACQHLRQKGYQIDMLLGDSRDADTIEAVGAREPFGAILLDGDHTFKGVTADWVNYGWMAPLVAFHDIVGEGEFEKVSGRFVEVPKLWAEIKAKRQTIEFIAPGSKMGIGVVCTSP